MKRNWGFCFVQLTVYLGKRDFVDHLDHVDPVGESAHLDTCCLNFNLCHQCLLLHFTNYMQNRHKPAQQRGELVIDYLEVLITTDFISDYY